MQTIVTPLTCDVQILISKNLCARSIPKRALSSGNPVACGASLDDLTFDYHYQLLNDFWGRKELDCRSDRCTSDRGISDRCTSDRGISDRCTLDRGITDRCTLDSQSSKCTYPSGFSGE